MEKLIILIEKYSNDEIDIEEILDNPFLNFNQFIELLRIEKDKLTNNIGGKFRYLNNIKNNFILLDYGKNNNIILPFISPKLIYQKYGEVGIRYYLGNHWNIIRIEEFKKYTFE